MGKGKYCIPNVWCRHGEATAPLAPQGSPTPSQARSWGVKEQTVAGSNWAEPWGWSAGSRTASAWNDSSGGHKRAKMSRLSPVLRDPARQPRASAVAPGRAASCPGLPAAGGSAGFSPCCPLGWQLGPPHGAQPQETRPARGPLAMCIIGRISRAAMATGQGG